MLPEAASDRRRPGDLLVLVLAPMGRDAESADRVLGAHGLTCRAFFDIAGLVAAIDDSAGVILVTEEALADGDLPALAAALDRQPQWSDIPFLCLSRHRTGPALRGDDRRHGIPARATNVMFLERPLSALSLISAVDWALAARRRQFEIRDYVIELESRATLLRESGEALRASEESLHLALNASEVVGAWDWNLRTGLVVADPRFARMYSVDPVQAATGVPAEQFTRAIDPRDQGRVAEAIERALTDGLEFVSEYRLTGSDGSVRWVLARGRCFHDETGAATRFPGVSIDITDRKLAEEAQREADTRLRLAIEAADIGIYDFYPVTGVLQWDVRCKALFGLSPDAEVSLDGPYMAALHPEDRDRNVEALLRALDPAGAGRLDIEYRAIGIEDGVERWIASRGRAIVENGVTVRFLGTVRDITERKRSEAALQESETRFRAITESMPQIVWAARADGHHDFFNQRWYDFTGARTAASDGDAWLSAVHPDDRRAARSAWDRALATGALYEVEYRLCKADGGYRWVLSRAQPIRDADGAITRWFGTCTDIDDQVQAREAQMRFGEDLERQVAIRTAELILANERLKAEMAEREQVEDALRQAQKMEAIGQLTGGIAHDFNNLLTGIIGNLELVQKRVSTGRFSGLDRFVKTAISSADRAAGLTHRLLAFSRRQSLDLRPVDVNALIVSMEDLLHRTLGEQTALSIELAPDLGAGRADENQLESALLNLAINARDAMPDGGRLRIATANVHVPPDKATDKLPPGDYVMMRVSDTGVGMPPTVLEKVFDPFFTTKPIGQGTGLGLSMIYGFVRQSGGQVIIDSEPGRGTTVSLYLKREAIEAPAVESVPEVEAPRAQMGETVLVVEDDPAVRLLVLEVLGELGYRALEAQDAAIALPTLESDQRIDLMITDVGLPGTNGRQLAEMARQHRPDLNVLFITGYAKNASVRSGFLDHGMEMMTKPFTLDALAAKIRGMMEEPRA